MFEPPALLFSFLAQGSEAQSTSMKDTDFVEVLRVQEVPVASRSFTFAPENFLTVSKYFLLGKK